MSNQEDITQFYQALAGKDGEIIKHTDDFNCWRWTAQALGLPGYLFGWSRDIQKRCIRQTSLLLKNFDSSRNVKILG